VVAKAGVQGVELAGGGIVRSQFVQARVFLGGKKRRANGHREQASHDDSSRRHCMNSERFEIFNPRSQAPLGNARVPKLRFEK
jgi:hypothetical protein